MKQMAEASSFNGELSIKSESEIHDELGFDELDHIPFKKRLKMLLASNVDSGRDVLQRASKRVKMSPSPINLAIKVEEAHNPSQELLNHSAVSIADVKSGMLSQEQIYTYADRIPVRNASDVPKVDIEVDSALVTLCPQNASSSQAEDFPRDWNRQETQANDSIISDQITYPEAKGGTISQEKVDRNIHNLTEHSNLIISTVKVKVEYSDSDLMSRVRDGTEGPDLGNVESIRVKRLETEIHDEPIADDLVYQHWNRQETQPNGSIYSDQITCPEAKHDNIALEKVDTNVHNLAHPNLTTSTIKVKVEYSDSGLMGRGRDGTEDPDHANIESIRVKTGSHDEPTTDELDHIPLNERKKVLLSRQTMGTTGQLHISGLLEGNSVVLSGHLIDDGKVKEESHSVDEQHSLTRNESHSIPGTNASELFKASTFDLSSSVVGTSCIIPQCSPQSTNTRANVLPKLSDSPGVQENDKICSTQKTSCEFRSSVRQQVLTDTPDNMLGSALSAIFVKVETCEDSLENPHKNVLGTYSDVNLLAVKGETGVSYKPFEDELDHMPLRQRMKLLISRKVSNLDYSRNLKQYRKTVPSVFEGIPAVPEKAKHGVVNCRRKRKKTATDSVETAMEEDAPGLLQVLIDKGILVDEIKLYGVMESEEAMDTSFEEDTFGDLEAVISKLFSERSSFLKFVPVRCPKGSKDSYCLSCLISLVEQSRYLQFRDWPVEWGWCRDLQSFIFVFERHNRIVLERPEYGYATYFFELVDSLPVQWQVKRLVTAMKLTSCSRATIIENKPLLVGEHLTEGEARVLEEYGWIPNSGLGSMLNYCDRVVHDKSNERDGAEWRSKIGKLLMKGYDGGTIILTNLPKKVTGYKSTRNPQIKLEPLM